MVTTAVALPACWPAVTDTRRAKPAPAVDLPITALSDIHVVAATVLPPSTTMALSPTLPLAPRPTIVTLAEPVEAVFDRTAALGVGPSTVTTLVNDPYPRETVDTTARLARSPDASLACTALVDTHVVVIDSDPDTRMPPERSADEPTCRPTTVTLVAPVDAALAMTTLLSDEASNDTVAICEPTCWPTEEATLQLNAPPATPLDTTAVSDTHAVTAITDPPMAACPLRSALVPTLVPTTVTLVDPEPTRLVITTLLGVALLTLTATANVPAVLTIVVCTARLRCAPAALFNCNAVDDTQPNATDVEPPTRALPDADAMSCAKCWPTTVTL
jgi:hypothetical protein